MRAALTEIGELPPSAQISQIGHASGKPHNRAVYVGRRLLSSVKTARVMPLCGGGGVAELPHSSHISEAAIFLNDLTTERLSSTVKGVDVAGCTSSK